MDPYSLPPGFSSEVPMTEQQARENSPLKSIKRSTETLHLGDLVYLTDFHKSLVGHQHIHSNRFNEPYDLKGERIGLNVKEPFEIVALDAGKVYLLKQNGFYCWIANCDIHGSKSPELT